MDFETAEPERLERIANGKEGSMYRVNVVAVAAVVSLAFLAGCAISTSTTAHHSL